MESIRDYTKALEVFGKTGSEEDEVLISIYGGRGTAYSLTNDWERSGENFEETLRLTREAGTRGLEAQALLFLSQVSFYQGRIVQALDYAQQAEALGQDIGHRQDLGGTAGLRSVRP